MAVAHNWLQRKGNRMIRTRTAIGVALTIFASATLAADQIPPDLVGVWATDGSVLKGQLLFEGRAMYLGADGVGAIVGGPPPIGFKIVATFDAQNNELELDAYEGAKRGPHSSFTFDPKSRTFDLGAPKHALLHRKFDAFPDETKNALGLK